MGWASYLEHIRDRRMESHRDDSSGYVGPAGKPIPQLNPELAAAFSRLRYRYERVAADILRVFEQERWLDLSNEMDELESEIELFSRSNVLAGETEILTKADGLDKRLNDILHRAKAIISYLNNLVMDIFHELETIQKLKRDGQDAGISDGDKNLEQNGIWLFHSWKALRSQVENLEARTDDIQIKLAGDTIECLMIKPDISIPDKDEE